MFVDQRIKLRAGLILGCFVLFLCFIAKSALAEIPISCGQAVLGSISTSGAKQTYSFNANTGNTVAIYANDTSGSLTCYLELYGPDGVILKKARERINYALPVTGKYTLVLRDEYNTRTGDFYLIYGIVSNNNWASPITLGQTVNSAISTTDRVKFYQFSANAGDIVAIRANNTSNFLNCYLELYSPKGTLLNKNNNHVKQALPLTGKYTLVLRDEYNYRTGNFYLVYGIVSNNNWSFPITLGQTIDSAVSAAHRVKFYQFSANTGDTVFFYVKEVTDSLDCYLELYGPNGAALNKGHNQIKQALPSTGKYTILLRDYYNINTGRFKLIMTFKNFAPLPIAVEPSTGTRIAESLGQILVKYEDKNGVDDIREAYLLINTSTGGANCAYVYYDQNTNKLYLRNDTGSEWLGGFSPGVPMIIENSYARIDCGQTTISLSGNLLQVQWAIYFKKVFAGRSYQVYLRAADNSGADSGFIQMGIVNIAAGTAPINIASFIPEDKSKFFEGTAINCLAAAEPAGEIYEYQYLIDGRVKREFAKRADWVWQTVSTDKGARTLTVKVRNQSGVIKEQSRKIIIYRMPIEPK